MNYKSKLIYEPKGKAREYSPLAMNPFLTCNHKCKYCYGPKTLHKKPEEFFCENQKLRNNFYQLFKKDLIQYRNSKQQVLLSFIGDLYCQGSECNYISRDILNMFYYNKIPVAILSKGGKRILKDIDIFKKFGNHIKVGQTFTFNNPDFSRDWEHGAALPEERIETAKILHESGIRTWASFEPVIYPIESSRVMEKVIPYIDEFRIGKLNYYNTGFKLLDYDWKAFIMRSVDLIRRFRKKVYVKKDLAAYYPEYLTADETDPDKWQAKPW